MADLCSDEQRWQIIGMFDDLGIKGLDQVKATAAQILMLDYLADLRELTQADAEELISELSRAKAQGRVSRD